MQVVLEMFSVSVFMEALLVGGSIRTKNKEVGISLISRINIKDFKMTTLIFFRKGSIIIRKLP